MKKLALHIFLLYSISSFGCSCELPQKILEYAESEYVFIGEAIKKEYSPDSLHYKITFKIKKHFKKGIKPKYLSFTLPSEGEYSGIFTSCDWSVDLGEIWLVYAKKEGNELTFGFHCSNSKPINQYKVSEKEWEVLKKGNTFDYSKLFFSQNEESNTPKPLSNIDFLLIELKKKHYSDHITGFDVVVADYDENGELIAANLRARGFGYKTLKYFDVLQYINLEYRIPSNEFENNILDFVRKLKKWEPLILQKNNRRVKNRIYFRFSLNKAGYIDIEYF